MLILIQIIRCCGQCSKCFLCLKWNFNLMVMNCQRFGYSVVVAKTFFIVIFLTSNMLISQRNISYLFLLNILCFIILVFHRWYKRRSNMIFLCMNMMKNGVQEGHGLMIQFFRVLMALYSDNSLSHNIKIDMILCVTWWWDVAVNYGGNVWVDLYYLSFYVQISKDIKKVAVGSPGSLGI